MTNKAQQIVDRVCDTQGFSFDLIHGLETDSGFAQALKEATEEHKRSAPTAGASGLDKIR